METNPAELATVLDTLKRHDIPYSHLTLRSTYQARSTSEDTELPALAATIKTVGLLQNLVVVERHGGDFEVCAGGRRFAAVGMLVADNVLPQDHPVPCIIIAAEHAQHASLIENDARKAMHPSDVYAAYARLRTDGMSVSAIATAHGASESAVRKLLALGNVSPKIMMRFRDDKISLDEIRALASVDDHARQEAAWAAAKNMWGHRPSDIRRLLADNEVRGDRPVARFLTATAYEKAGGIVRRDLFETGPSSTFFTDPVLLEKLALDKLKRSKIARSVEKEGLAWVEYRASLGYEQRKAYGEVSAQRRELTSDEDQQLSAAVMVLAQAQAKLEEIEQADEFDHDAHQRAHAHLNACNAEVDALEESFKGYPAELMPYLGAIVYIDHAGDPVAEHGFIRQQDRHAVASILAADANGQSSAGIELPPAQTRPVHSAALVARLQAEKTIALQAELMDRPKLALALLIEKFVIQQSHISGFGMTSAALDIHTSEAAFELKQVHPDIVGTKAWRAVTEREDEHRSRTPDDEKELLPWLSNQSETDLLEYLALLVAKTVFRHRLHASSDDAKHLDGLMHELGLNMATWWQPTAADYFQHVSKERTLDVIRSAQGDVDAALTKLKKGDLVAQAETLMADSNWLPEPLRTPTSNANA